MSQSASSTQRSAAFVVLALAVAAALVWAFVGRGAKLQVAPEPLVRNAVPMWSADAAAPAAGLAPRNIILFVADGFGFAHLTAARAAQHGIDGEGVWDRFEASSWQRAHPATGLLTDSAASATAMSTGHATFNGAVGVGPEGQALLTLLEVAQELGHQTGVVTDSYVWDATPAAFAAHVSDRDESAEILRQLGRSQLDVLMGELEDLGEDGNPEWDESVALLAESFAVSGPEPSALEEVRLQPSGTQVVALFEEDQVTDLESSPTLPAMVDVALERLRVSGGPFALVVESEECDSASHNNDFPRVLRGLAAIEQTLGLLLDFAEARGDTLVVFTADHETGALAITTDPSNLALAALWGSDGHSAAPVPVLAYGPGANTFTMPRANWQLGRDLHALLRGGAASDAVVEAEPRE